MYAVRRRMLKTEEKLFYSSIPCYAAIRASFHFAHIRTHNKYENITLRDTMTIRVMYKIELNTFGSTVK